MEGSLAGSRGWEVAQDMEDLIAWRAGFKSVKLWLGAVILGRLLPL